MTLLHKVLLSGVIGFVTSFVFRWMKDHNANIVNMLNRHRKRRVEREWKRKFPDPLIVCGISRSCSHVDGFLCIPRTCSDLRERSESIQVFAENLQRLAKIGFTTEDFTKLSKILSENSLKVNDFINATGKDCK